MYKFFGITFLLLISLTTKAQNGTAETEQDTIRYIQFSGFAVDADSLIPVPYTMVYNSTRKSGKLSDVYGYFSLVAAPGDRIRFSSVTYQESYFTIPDTITNDKYTMYYLMEADTTLISPVVIYPWPSKEEFADAFVNFDVPDDDLERAKKNMAREKMRQQVLGTPGDRKSVV